MSAQGSPPPRGRPPGSITLTPERHEAIVAYIRAGAFDHAAAQAVGISPRTFRDWIARGEGRGPRPANQKLRRFAEDVRQARAEARIAAEVRVYREQPVYWLSRTARTREDASGWTEPVSQPGGDPARMLSEMSREELERHCEEIVVRLAADGILWSPPCTRRRCRCEFHVAPEERGR